MTAVMAGVREYSADYPVELREDEDNGRLVIRAINEGGHNVTHVDLLDLLAWLRSRRPDLLAVEVTESEFLLRNDGESALRGYLIVPRELFTSSEIARLRDRLLTQTKLPPLPE